ncbi:MAG TPA: hypothetical protein PK406_00740 [Verrucomicrobiota bacterium]|nr:hypothetical protein [Verrucomicrobiota bacterium]
MTTGAPADFRDTFMDYDKLRDISGWVCPACLFCMSDQCEPLRERTGKDKLQRMRNYSHIVLDGVWYPLSKAQKRETYNLLLQKPAVAVIAMSGQKHLICRAQAGWWQVEESRARPDAGYLRQVMDWVSTAYNLGFSKGEIETGNYSTRRILDAGASSWEVVDAHLRPLRGQAMFELAVYLAQREEMTDGEGVAGQGLCGAGLGAVAGNRPGLQAQICTGDLGPVPGATAGGGDDHGQPAGVLQPRLW